MYLIISILALLISFIIAIIKPKYRKILIITNIHCLHYIYNMEIHCYTY